MSPEAVLDALAASVADGQPLDWRRLEAEAAPRDRRLIRHLRLVENISSLYRSIPDLDETVDDGTPEGPRWGRLVLLGTDRGGTSCDVHRAFDTDLHRHVALKLLHADGLGHQGRPRSHPPGSAAAGSRASPARRPGLRRGTAPRARRPVDGAGRGGVARSNRADSRGVRRPRSRRHRPGRLRRAGRRPRRGPAASRRQGPERAPRSRAAGSC